MTYYSVPILSSLAEKTATNYPKFWLTKDIKHLMRTGSVLVSLLSIWGMFCLLKDFSWLVAHHKETIKRCFGTDRVLSQLGG